MKSYVSITRTLVLGAVLIAGFISCEVASNNAGQLSLSLTDKPTHDFQAVYVTIKNIAVHAEDDPEDSWYTVLEVNQTFELTALGNGMREQLGIVNLDPGHYTQLRIMIGTEADEGINILGNPHPAANYVIDSKEKEHVLKIPSGIQTGIKLVHGFDINANSTTELTFDFDASRSVVVAGNSGKCILKPVIHTIDDSEVRTIIQGTVKTAEDAPLEGALVSLQEYNSSATDLKDAVTVRHQQYTDDTGAYMFFFLDEPNEIDLNFVATKWDSDDPYYAPDWDQVLDVVNGGSYVVDFVLPVPAEVGTLSLKAIIADEDVDTNTDPIGDVMISIRQLTALSGTTPPLVEVRTSPISGYDDELGFTGITPVEIIMPVGDYKVVAWTAGRVTLEQDISITAAGPNEIEFTFEVPTTD